MKIKWHLRLSLSFLMLIVLVFTISLKTLAQNLQVITGTVIDRTHGALAGVNVKVKNTNTAVMTDAKGKFSLPARSTDILVFTYLGYQAQEVAVGTKTTIDVFLQETMTSLDEVVVVGYGTSTKRDITGSITSASSKQIEERSPINVFDAIQGQAPGVQISQEDGRAGAGSSIVIRGIGTLGANSQPLYIVDGAQGVNIDGINPLDIERIEILKDASSSAIYGSRAANGVIIITTKRGVDGKPRIDLNYTNGYSQLAHRIEKSNAPLRRLFGRQMSAADDGTGTTGLSADSLNPGNNADIDSYGILTRTAIRHDASLSMSGATQTLKYYAGLQYLGDEGIIHNSWAKIGRFRLNADYIPSQKFSFTTSLAFSLRNENLVNEANTIQAGLSRGPNTAIYWMDGTLAPNLGSGNNPLAWALLYRNELKTWDANIYNKVNYKINKDLQLSTNVSLKYQVKDGFTFTPRRIVGNIALNPQPPNRGSESNDLVNNWLVESFLNYNKKLGDHTITGLLGGSGEKNFSSRFSISASDYVSEEVVTLNSAQVFGIPSSSASRNAGLSGFGKLGYNYKGKYQINGILRADASSRFGAANRWGYFPSVSAAWNISQESFMAWAGKVVDDAKIRGGYGVVGNSELGNYDAIQRYVFGTNFYNGVSGVVNASRFGNNNLGWETTKEITIGTDIALFKGRANFVADYYDKVTSDLLYTSPMAQEAGFADVNVNTGTIQNKGFEFLVSGYAVRTRDFQWNIGYNMSFNRGKVKKLVDGIPILRGAGSLTEEGQPLGNFWGWKALGVYAYNESNAYTADFKQRLLPVIVPGTTPTNYTVSGYTYMDGKPYTGPKPSQMRTQAILLTGGDVIWEDLDNNGAIDNSDRKVVGNAQADYSFGLTNSLDYKRFQLSFNFYGSMGGQIYNGSAAANSGITSTSATPMPYYIINAWRKPGDVTDVPKNKFNNPVLNNRTLSSRYVEDGSFIRLRNVKVGYSLPTNVASRIGASRVGLYVQVNNLATWSNYSWLDPEMSQSNPLSLGVESGRVPRKNEMIFGLNVNF